MKTEVYSWRLSAQKKLELEIQAKREGTSMAHILEEISSEWLNRRRDAQSAEACEQERIRERVMAIAGSLSGGDPHRAANASSRVREILRERYGRKRAH